MPLSGGPEKSAIVLGERDASAATALEDHVRALLGEVGKRVAKLAKRAVEEVAHARPTDPEVVADLREGVRSPRAVDAEAHLDHERVPRVERTKRGGERGLEFGPV